MLKKLKKTLLIFLLIIAILLAYVFFSQIILPHKDISFTPDYPKTELTEESSYKEIFMQTGLGKATAEKIKAEHGIDRLKEFQEMFYAQREIECQNLLGFFTKSDRLVESQITPQFADIKEGDIFLSLSNHSLGWRHGHAGLAVNDTLCLESPSLGSDVTLYYTEHWRKYSQFAVLRLKNITPERQQELVAYSLDELNGKPYKVTSGFFGEKSPETESKGFGVHCSYLVWYIYNHFGVDIDSNGGRLASTYDILNSPELDIIQIYGINPNILVDRIE